MDNIFCRKIYLASSWRNNQQAELVIALRAAGHEVYDFKNPSPNNTGFSWSHVDQDWQNWTPEQFADRLNNHPIRKQGFAFDKAALEWCDTCVLALPCGRSAHLELGYAAGQGKDTYVLLHEDKFEPELMYLLNTAVATSIEEIIELMKQRNPKDLVRWHQHNGGHFKTPSSHALRLLREVVELCLAAGGSSEKIYYEVTKEIDRQIQKPNYNKNGDPSSLSDEIADCRILLDLFAQYANINQNEAVRTKLDKLWDIPYQPDTDGVLWRNLNRS